MSLQYFLQLFLHLTVPDRPLAMNIQKEDGRPKLSPSYDCFKLNEKVRFVVVKQIVSCLSSRFLCVNKAHPRIPTIFKSASKYQLV